MERDHYVFGWGHRVCPGMHLAEASMLLLVSRIPWAFNLTTAKDKDGRDINVTADPDKA
jgi:cytochrome P450